MKVFISWSGERSRAAAKELHEWLQLIMPITIEPWMSDTDLDKGSRWAVGLGEGLEEMSAGISILTPENLASPWLNFEAGAIGKAFGEGRVMTFLIGLSPTDVPQPLAQFQATSRTREDVTKMITDLNKLTETPMKDHILAKQMEAWWPQLDRKLTDIEDNAPAGMPPKRSTNDMLEEVLTLLRDMSRQPDSFMGAGSLAAGLFPSRLTDIDAMYRLEPAPPVLVRRGSLVRRAQRFAATALGAIIDHMGSEAVDETEIYLSEHDQEVLIVSDLTFTTTNLNYLQALARRLDLSLGFAPREAFQKESRKFIRLRRDRSIEESGHGEE